ncbi:MAG: patatin-like phospholipase family protein [Lachnospiraceae bacterium]|nr:patatin-like phospholipase family protein [Lachnospiraceae bacterium]
MNPVINLDKEYGIVLEGGGARGAYQVGVWRALKEAGVKIRGISGTSVGALNGVMICMDDLEGAERIWESMSYSRVLNIDEKLIAGLKNLGTRSLDFSDVAAEMKKIVSGRGLDITPLKVLIREMADEERVRRSPRDFFATSFCVTDRKEVNFDVKKVPQGMIGDVLLASSYFPGFRNEKIDGKTYMDGGSVNNVPINVLADRGYKDIIVVRIFGIGVDREKLFELPKDVKLYRVAPRKNLGGILEFDCERTKRNMKLGYYDGLRMIYGLEGRKYYLDMPYSEAYYFDKLMSEMVVFKSYLTPYLKEDSLDTISGYRAYTERIFPYLAKRMKLSSDWDYRDLYGAILEVCAKKMDMEVFAVYTADDIMGRVQRILGENNKWL